MVAPGRRGGGLNTSSCLSECSTSKVAKVQNFVMVSQGPQSALITQVLDAATASAEGLQLFSLISPGGSQE